MSLFSSIIRDLNHDPFFSGQLDSMRRMESMMDNIMAPFGGRMMPLGGFPHFSGNFNGRSEQINPFGNTLMPFGFGRSLFPNINNIFTDMEPVPTNPSLHSYSSSSVMTYTTDELGRPQVYQATSSTRSAPGGVKETRNSVQDSRSGVQKMAIGHHLGERAHIIGKERNRYTGDQIDNQEFINVDEEEAEAFNEEWQEKACPMVNNRPNLSAIQYPRQVLPVPAIASGPTIVEITESPEEESGMEIPIITKPPKNTQSTSGSSMTGGPSRKREEASNYHVHRSEGKHKRRHHAYGKFGHRADKAKSSRSKHETN